MKKLTTLLELIFLCWLAFFIFDAPQCNKEKDFVQQEQPSAWNADSNELYKEFAGDVWDTTFTESTDVQPIITRGSSRSFATYLIIQNHQLFWNDNIPAKIIEANSPELVFHFLDYNWLNWLFSKGVNTIYASLNSKESGKPRISPYKNNDINQGFDDAKVNQMVAFAVYWCSLSERNMLHLLLSEKETHFLYTDYQRKQAMAYLVQKFAPVAGRIIWDREEFPTGQTAQAQNLYGYLQQIDQVNIRAMHNDTNRDPWAGFYNTTTIQFLSFQEWYGNFDRRIRGEVSKFPTGVTGYASEMTGGFQTNDVAKAEQLWNAAPGYNAGVGVYISCCDHRDTRDNWYRAYEPVYARLAQLAGNSTNPPPPPDDTVVVPPPPAGFSVMITTNSNRTGAQAMTDGATYTTAHKYVFVPTEQGVKPVKFTLSGTTFTEWSAPWDMKGGWTNANPYPFTPGSYTLTVTNGNGQSITINFTVN